MLSDIEDVCMLGLAECKYLINAAQSFAQILTSRHRVSLYKTSITNKMVMQRPN